jgi:mono/diheme cytochrome c family protein
VKAVARRCGIKGEGRVKTLAAMAILALVELVGAEHAAPGTRSERRQDEKPAGQAAYDRVCKVCHGPEGRGDAAPRLVPFTRQYEEVLGIVREGTGQMPPISPRQLADEEVAGIVGYLSKLD